LFARIIVSVKCKSNAFNSEHKIQHKQPLKNRVPLVDVPLNGKLW